MSPKQLSIFEQKTEFIHVKSVIGSGYEHDVATLAIQDGIAKRAARKNMQIHSAIILKLDDKFAGFMTFQDNHEVKEFCLLQSAMYQSKKDKKIYREAWSRPGALTGGLNWYRASAQYGYGYDIKDFSVRVPTLVIWGMDDEFILSSNLNGLDGFVPDLTIKEVEGASHWIIHEKPELVNKYIKEFLSKK
jgi:pimeloyl-ACP methyl ester carboxylesterase